MKTYDVIVLGVGTMGAAAACEVARQGESVLGLEQHAIPHLQGAHHGFSRLIRLAYYEHPHYVPLLRRAYDLWDRLETESKSRILHRTGGIYIGLEGEEFIQGAINSARRHRLDYVTMNAREVADTYPMFRLSPGYVGFYEDAAGFVVPEAAMAAHVNLALAHGADLRGHVKVASWEAEAGPQPGVVVRTSQGETFRGRRLIITAGAWTSNILADLRLGLSVTRQTWGWFWPPDPQPFTLGNFPCWFYEDTPGGGHYGFPMMPDNPGFKVAHHVATKVSIDPDHVNRTITNEDESPLRAFLGQHIPEANGNLLAIRTCLYTNSPDTHFIIDHHPYHPHVVFACGFSGHGFKFAPVMGEILAEMALQGRTRHPIDFLSLSRFR